MTEARVLPDGTCELTDPDEGTVRWPAATDWADAWVSEWLRNARGPASAFLDALTRTAGEAAVPVLTVLAQRASSDAEIVEWVGSGPLEDLLSRAGDEAVIDAVERAARAEPALHRALAHVWLSDSVPPAARARLTQLGARDMTGSG